MFSTSISRIACCSRINSVKSSSTNPWRSGAALRWMGVDSTSNGEGGVPPFEGKGTKKKSMVEPEPHEVAQVPLTCWDWKPLDLQGRCTVIQEYLDRKVTAVVLPEKVKGDKTFPGLILDGASGVGKTQQAFALLNNGKQELVYMLLIDADSEASQSIYEEISAKTGMSGILQMVDATRKTVSANAAEHGKDPFGVAFLYGLLNSNLGLLDGVVQLIADRVLMYDQDLNILSKTVFSSKKQRTLDDSIHRLAGTVLFLDEVFPLLIPPNQDPSEEALSRLRFLRNIGRALGMRVVMAGTAATAANMISLRTTGANAAMAASRRGAAECGWMQIQFLWNRVQLPLHGPTVHTGQEERPYLLSLLEKMEEQESEKEILQYLAGKIIDDKRFTDESKLIWLSGCWLASENAKPPPSAFAIGPADLVRGHFFEPALAVSVADKKPHMGKGTEHRKRVMGPLRIALQRYRNTDQKIEIIWWVLLTHNFDEGYSANFTGVEAALTHCVQSCLAIEPVLAVALSMNHKFSAHEFGQVFSELWNESPTQQTVGSMDGELNEYVMFAILQMACRADDGANFPPTRSVADMVERMLEYLSPAQPDSPPAAVVREVRNTSSGFRVGTSDVIQSQQQNMEYSYGRDGKADESSIRGLHKETMMPWLVPACSRETLQEKIQETQRGNKSLFSGMGIAGLAPGGTKHSSFDASAYLWESEDKSKCAPLDWNFEFKGRSRRDYTLGQARDVLESKCRKNKNEGNFHSMIIVVTGDKKSKCRIWLEDGKLRIVLLFGSCLL